MKRFLVGVMIAVVLAASALVYCANAGYWSLQLIRTIDPVALANLAITIVIAIWLQYYLAARLTNKRAEKDLLIDNTRDTIAALKYCREILTSCHETARISSEAKRSLIQGFRRLSNSVEALEVALDIGECKLLTKDVLQIKMGCFNYKVAATRAPFPAKAYTAGDLSDQEQSFQSVHKLLMRLLFDINKSE